MKQLTDSCRDKPDYQLSKSLNCEAQKRKWYSRYELSDSETCYDFATMILNRHVIMDLSDQDSVRYPTIP